MQILESTTQPLAELPLVSVAVPTFKRPEYLRRALESAVSQTYRNIEILVGDNENSNATAEVVESFNDPRITYFGRESNLGMAMNVLSLFRRAKGKYFCVLADDDFWGERFVSELVVALEAHPMVAMAFTDYHVVDGAGDINLGLTEATTHHWGRDQLQRGVYQPAFDIGLVSRGIPLVSALFRREAVDLEQFKLEAANTYDLWLCYLALANGGGAYYHNERLSYCRMHDGQDSAQAHLALDLNASMCYEHFLKDERLNMLHAAFRKEIVLRRTRAGTQMLHMGRAVEARPQLWRAAQLCPTPRAVIALLISLLPPVLATRVSHGLRGLLGATRQFATTKTRLGSGQPAPGMDHGD